MQASFRNLDEFCHGAIYPIPESQSAGIEIIESPPSKGRIFINDGRRFTYYPVTFFKISHSTANLSDCAAKFVPQYNRIIDLPAMGTMPLMEITPTHAGCTNFQKNVLLSNFGNRDFPEFHTSRCGGIIDYRRHRFRHVYFSFPTGTSPKL